MKARSLLLLACGFWFGSTALLTAQETALIELPKSSVALQSTSYDIANEGAKLAAAGKTRLAEELLGKAVIRHPQSPEVLYNFGLVLALNGNLQQAAQAQGKAIELRPGFAEAHLAIGTVFLGLQQNEEAVKAFENASKLASASETGISARYNLAIALGRVGRDGEGEQILSELLAENPDDALPALQIGRLKLRRRLWNDAIAWLDAARHQYPLEAGVLRGQALAKLGRWSEALETVRQTRRRLQTDGVDSELRTRLEKHLQAIESEVAAGRRRGEG